MAGQNHKLKGAGHTTPASCDAPDLEAIGGPCINDSVLP